MEQRVLPCACQHRACMQSHLAFSFAPFLPACRAVAWDALGDDDSSGDEARPAVAGSSPELGGGFGGGSDSSDAGACLPWRVWHVKAGSCTVP